jgi:hypothetical protein
MAEYVVEFGRDGGRIWPDGRLDAPAFHRNHAAILRVLAGFLQQGCGDVLEVGSGTGQHVMHFAEHLPDITWWPSDLNEAHLGSIEAWRLHSRRANVRPPMRIDLTDPEWCAELRDGCCPPELRAILCANVIHIAPWSVAKGLIAGAARYLRADGRLFIYGAFKRGGKHTAASNEAFDASLRSGNPEWGVRDVDDLDTVAQEHGLALAEIVEMPANNLILVVCRATG